MPGGFPPAFFMPNLGIQKMPDWKPAENAKGQKVKQEVEIPFLSGGGC